MKRPADLYHFFPQNPGIDSNIAVLPLVSPMFALSQIGTHLIVHLLRIGIAERVAHLMGDLAEERCHAVECSPRLLRIQRNVCAGKRRPDVWWEQLLEAAPMNARLHRPVMIDLDAP